MMAAVLACASFPCVGPTCGAAKKCRECRSSSVQTGAVRFEGVSMQFCRFLQPSKTFPYTFLVYHFFLYIECSSVTHKLTFPVSSLVGSLRLCPLELELLSGDNVYELRHARLIKDGLVVDCLCLWVQYLCAVQPPCNKFSIFPMSNMSFPVTIGNALAQEQPGNPTSLPSYKAS